MSHLVQSHARLISLTECECSQTYANITSLNLHSSGISCYIQEVVLTYVPRRLNKCLLPHFIPPSNTGKRAAKDLYVLHRSVLPAGSFFRGRNWLNRNNTEVNLGDLRGCCCLQFHELVFGKYSKAHQFTSGMPVAKCCYQLIKTQPASFLLDKTKYNLIGNSQIHYRMASPSLKSAHTTLL